MSNFPQVSEARQKSLQQSYEAVLSQVNLISSTPVRLVAVSKLKPASDIMALYNVGVRHFGENYVQELITKAQELPKDINWHFIGGLQSGKCKDLARDIEHLYAVETIDSFKKCKKLDTSRTSHGGSEINIYLQINTSGEEQKSGFALDDPELDQTVEYLKSEECKSLKLKGLMTIGSFTESTSEGDENLDFKKLVELKQRLQGTHGVELELSMGMSSDFIQAIKQGSSSVRVGTAIFGERPPRN
ncbi:uncharacterized protein CANTADRAFT_91948 [Suhomyces tanzawaensis NRRL Y-17324]|uniref:Pyridoxal phosphate homeostasis protein n=1 Tax=Suhomyces tanzawaensis NRRL Y-17324 TaxID=984487 RepID=A0A1E4SDG4_9ASCO|nr:uncharacterized protein CANTADRAFT_91948 [Suhomyces tanzawaensis NRRL Y-17324]ODV77506.1 hypothetical protein CANTADRAFT_91948 [Suhomyces tanzawaensis NRRL Y-17324]